jgi:uncharacterized protein (TIGR03435 family)
MYAFLLLGLLVQSPKFDITSVKRSAPEGRHRGFRVSPGGEWIARGWPLKELIAEVFLLEGFQIPNVPKWMDTDRYDFDAKPEDTGKKVDRELVRFMIQQLIVDRFQLKFHWETKEATQYELVVAKGGPKLKDSTASDDERHYSRGFASGNQVKMDWLTAELVDNLRRAVTDHTGLAGKYDIVLRFTPDDAFDPDSPPTDSAGPSLFTALQEQLGLKLVSKKAPLKFMVIDSVEKAREN